MAWIELHDNLPDHRKVLDVSEALKMDKDMVVGKLVRLWTWAINNRDDGTFKFRDAATIAEVMRFKGPSSRLINALVAALLLDVTDDGYVIHDWDERVGMLLEKRETVRAQNRARAQKHRKKKTCNAVVTENNAECNALHERYVTPNVTQCNAATVPYHTVPYKGDTPPIPPFETSPPSAGSPKPKRRNPSKLSKEQEARFNRFWAAYPKKVSIGDAEKAWAKISPDDALTERIIEAVKTAKDKDGRFRERKYTPHPATWINGRDWENQYDSTDISPLPPRMAYGGRPNTLGILEAMLTEGGG